MANEITTSLLNVVTSIGDSVVFGWAGEDDLFDEAPHLLPNQGIIWKDVWVFTNKQGWPNSPDVSPRVHPSWTIEDGAWLEMTSHLIDSPGDTHPHPSPYEYPNVVGCPLPTYLYDAVWLGLGDGTMVGFDIPLMWNLSSYYADQVGLVKVAVPGSFAMRYDQGGNPDIWFGDLISGSNSPDARPYSWVDTPTVSYNWWTPADRMDWDPSTGRLYASWLAKMIAARDALPSDTVMNVDLVVIGFGNNDCGAATGASTPRVAYWSDFVKKVVAKIRYDLVANNLTVNAEHQVKVVWLGVAEGFGTPTSDTMNSEAAAVAANDPWMKFLDVDDVDKHSDNAHPNAPGYLSIAALIADAVREMDLDPYDAMDGSDRLTVSKAFEKIRLKFARSKVNTDMDDDVLMEAANEAMFHILGELGDAAYWIARRHTISLSGGGVRSPVTLPRQVHQITTIEDPYDTTAPIMFEEVGRVDGGRLQIVITNRSSGTYTVRYLRNPPELSSTSEKVPIPQRYLYWWYAEICALLSSSSSNPIQRAAFEAEAMKAKRSAMAKASATTRGKRQRLYTQRRLPDPLRRRKSR